MTVSILFVGASRTLALCKKPTDAAVKFCFCFQKRIIGEGSPKTRPAYETKLEIISTLLRRIGIPPPTALPGESLCIKTGNQI